MCNNGFGGNNICWIVLLLILFCNCGGNGMFLNNGGCGCGCDNNNCGCC